MHTFGHLCKIDEIAKICNKYHIELVEDAAESLGSYYSPREIRGTNISQGKNKHTGTFGLIGVLSFNGNKIITAGGGGMLLFNDETLAHKAKHLTTQAKEIQFVEEPVNARSNYWLNCLLLPNRHERDAFLKSTNENGIMTRPVWELMNRLPMFKDAQCGKLSNAERIADRLVNVPSSVIA